MPAGHLSLAPETEAQPSEPSATPPLAATITTTTTAVASSTTTTTTAAILGDKTTTTMDRPALTLSSQAQSVKQSIESGARRLARAIRAGNVLAVEAILADGLQDVPLGKSTNARAQRGHLSTPFYLAIKHGKLDIAGRLLDRGANMDQPQKNGWSPLLKACAEGRAQTLAWLLKQGADTVQLKMPEAWTLLHAAVMNPDEAVFDVLRNALKPEAFRRMCDTPDRYGSTPLSLAAEWGLKDAVLQALQPEKPTPPLLLTPIHLRRGWIVVGSGYEHHDFQPVIDAGTKAGIEMHTCGDGRQDLDWTAFKALKMQAGDAVALFFHSGWVAGVRRFMVELGKGVWVPLTDVVRVLLEKGVLNIALFGCEVEQAMWPLLRRLEKDSGLRRPINKRYDGLNITAVGGKHLNLTRLSMSAMRLWLLDIGTQLATGTAGDALDRLSPQKVHKLFSNGDGLTYREGIEVDANHLSTRSTPEEREQVKADLLHMHAFDGQLDAVKKLIQQHGVDPDVPTDEGITALLLASFRGHQEVVGFLVEQTGVQIDRAGYERMTPLWIACELGDIGMVRMLLDKKANIEQSNNEKWTPLHAACHSGHIDIIKLLLARGAHRTALTRKGSTPLDLAPTDDHEEIADLMTADFAG